MFVHSERVIGHDDQYERQTHVDSDRHRMHGTIVEIRGLTKDVCLNGKCGIIVAHEKNEDGRWSVYVVDVRPPRGVNVRPENMNEVTKSDVDRVRMWNDVGVAYADSKCYASARGAFDSAVKYASSNTACDVVRMEGCRALSNMAWVCLTMNENGIEFDDEQRTHVILNGTMRNLFNEVIRDSPDDGVLSFGAGHVPSVRKAVLVMTMTTTEEGGEKRQRHFFYDEERICVREVVSPVTT